MTIRESDKFDFGPVGFGWRKGSEIEPYAGQIRLSEQVHRVDPPDGKFDLASHGRIIEIDTPDQVTIPPCGQQYCLEDQEPDVLSGEEINYDPITNGVVAWSQTQLTDIVTMAAIAKHNSIESKSPSPSK